MSRVYKITHCVDSANGIAFGGGGGGGTRGKTNGARGIPGSGSPPSRGDVVRAANIVTSGACTYTKNPVVCGAAAITNTVDAVVNHNWGQWLLWYIKIEL